MPRWLYFLLIAVPASLLAEIVGLPTMITFVLAALGIVPLAALIGAATDVLGEHVGPRIGGLLTATFGNAAELIIGITALSAGLPNVVRASITGSIIDNALFVLGLSMLVGGWRFGLQHFNSRHAGQYSSMLALAVVGLAIPSVVATVGGGQTSGTNIVQGVSLTELSLVVSVILLVSYAAYIAYSIFGLRASPRAPKRHNMEGMAPTDVKKHAKAETQARKQGKAVPKAVASERASASRGTEKEAEHGKEAEDEGETGLIGRVSRLWESSIWLPVVVLGVVTALTAIVSETLVNTIEPLTHQIGLSPFFVGLIVLPLVGNAAEFTSALRMTLDDRMEGSMAITAGASIQTALLVAPVLVLVSAVIGGSLDLDFTRLELVIFALIAGLYALVSLDGESTWLEGLQLCAFYLIVAVVAFFIPG